MFFSPCSTLLTDTFLNIPEGNEGCLSCTILMYFIICSKKFFIFHDKMKDSKYIQEGEWKNI